MKTKHEPMCNQLSSQQNINIMISNTRNHNPIILKAEITKKKKKRRVIEHAIHTQSSRS